MLCQGDDMNKGNDNIFGDSIVDESSRILDVEDKVADLLSALGIDWRRDPNMSGTPLRVARMLVSEMFSGRYLPMPDETTFPNESARDSLDIIGPLTVRSTCSHHLMPVSGKAWIGIIHGDRLLGLSKYKRLLDWVFLRPQIQEQAVVQYADLLEKLLEPKALAVVVKASHCCMTCSGIKESAEAQFTTSVMRGVFRDDAAARAEFLTLIKV